MFGEEPSNFVFAVTIYGLYFQMNFEEFRDIVESMTQES